VRAVESRLTGLSIAEFSEWSRVLDDALAQLPELSSCTHDVYRTLAVPRGDVRKKFVLVTRGDTPAAVVALRSGRDCWEPVTTWIVPGIPFPHAGVAVRDILHAIALPLTVAWWRCSAPPPASRRIVAGPPEPTYRLPAAFDAEAHWRASSLWADIEKARRRCAAFRVVTDEPGANAWVIRNWGRAWNVAPPHVEDTLAAAELRTTLGTYHNLTVYDGDRRIAGATHLTDGGDLVGQAMYRDADYERASLGTFVIDRVFAWCVAQRFSGLDFGGSAAYKERWAPAGGQKYTVNVMPLSERVARRAGVSFTD